MSKFKPVAREKPNTPAPVVRKRKTKRESRNIKNEGGFRNRKIFIKQELNNLVEATPREASKVPDTTTKSEGVHENSNEIFVKKNAINPERMFNEPLKLPFGRNDLNTIPALTSHIFQIPSTLPLIDSKIKVEFEQKVKQNQLDNALLSHSYPKGKIGRMKRYRNGKMKLLLGSEEFIVAPANKKSFKEICYKIDSDKIQKVTEIDCNYVVTPRI